MASAVANGTNSVGNRAHEAGMNMSAWTWAGWVKRTGAGAGDFRLLNKAAGSAIGSPNITGQSANVTRLRGRMATGTSSFDLAITPDGALSLNTWVCMFVVYDQGGAGLPLRIYKYDGVSSIVEQTPYSSTTDSGAVPAFNTANLTFFNSTDNTLGYAGKAAHWVLTDNPWDSATMLSFAQGTIPAGVTDHYWPLQSDGADQGQVGGWTMTLSNVTFDGADSPPVTYGAPDTEDPTVPTGLAVTDTTDTTVSLSWSAATDNIAVTGYRLYRDGVLDEDVAGTTAVSTGLTPSTAYNFTISAYDAAGNESAQSSPAVVGTTDAPPPEPLGDRTFYDGVEYKNMQAQTYNGSAWI